MELSSLFVVVVFVLGSVVGGLFVSLQRQCYMERIEHEFEQALEEQVRKSMEARITTPVAAEQAVAVAESAKTEQRSPMTEPVDEAELDSGDGWNHLLVTPPENANRPHA
jgi:hypothetical protein